MTDENKTTIPYTTVSGHAIEFVPVNDLVLQRIHISTRNEYLANGAPLDPPTYAVTVGSGKKQQTETHNHTEKSIQNASAEDQALWDEHQAALEAYNRTLLERRAQALLLRGTRFEYADDWEAIQAGEGIEIPTNESEKRLHYIMTELFTYDEMQLAILKIRQANRKAEEVVTAQIEAEMQLFRDSLGQSE